MCSVEIFLKMTKDQYSLINRITDNSIVFISVLAIPLNIIIYFALRESEYQFPRYIPPLLGLVTVLAAFLRGTIPLKPKLWGFITILFLTGCYNLLLGLIDMASLWFVLAIVYALFISRNKEALVLFGVSFLVVLVVGILMITKISFIPLQYKFETCQFACVAVRILHFLLVGSLIYYILNTFFSTIQENLTELEKKSADLEKSNLALEKEIIEKNAIQQKMIDAVILTEEKERRRFASDLHDGLGPVLSAINLFFQAYLDVADSEGKAEIEAKLKKTIDSAITDVSRISHNISPHIIEHYGLATALDNFIKPIVFSGKLTCDIDYGPVQRFDLEKELSLYRTLTELIHNTVRHADASNIKVSMTVAEGRLRVQYEDNGKGFDLEGQMRNKKGLGLKSIHNRIQSIGGKITLKSIQHQGMQAMIDVPYEEVAAHGSD
jgi:signal transduction histidine kinase